MRSVYGMERFTRNNFHNRSQKNKLIDQFIKEGLIGLPEGTKMSKAKEFLKDKKLLFLIGDGCWSNSAGLNFGAQMSSSRQIVKRFREVIHQFKIDNIDLISISEAFTTKSCSKCHEKSMRPIFVEKETENGVKYLEQTRTFYCNNKECPSKGGEIDRDDNASMNIGQNAIFWSFGLGPQLTTWRQRGDTSTFPTLPPTG